MKTNPAHFFAALLAGGVLLAATAAGLERADGSDAPTKAQLAQFDRGPATIDVSKYPPKLQADYRVFSRTCSHCHKLSRPINCSYVLPEQWSRYIKRMMYKPGSGISRSKAKKIYDFLVYDASVRKKKKLAAALAALSPGKRAAQKAKIKAVVEKYQ